MMATSSEIVRALIFLCVATSVIGFANDECDHVKNKENINEGNTDNQKALDKLCYEDMLAARDVWRYNYQMKKEQNAHELQMKKEQYTHELEIKKFQYALELEIKKLQYELELEIKKEQDAHQERMLNQRHDYDLALAHLRFQYKIAKLGATKEQYHVQNILGDDETVEENNGYGYKEVVIGAAIAAGAAACLYYPPCYAAATVATKLATQSLSTENIPDVAMLVFVSVM